MKKYSIFSLVVLGLVLSGVCMAVEIAMEAELAVIAEPMVIGVPADALAQGGPEPDAPSRGKFVWAPGPPLTGGGGSGFLQFEVNIPQAGVYTVWGRCISWDGNSDSLWVTWLPADPDENPQETQNTQFRWTTGSGNTWYWRKVNQWLDGGTFMRQWDLPAGPTTLTFWSREDACMLDCIFITDNLSDDEAEVSPRVPTDEDLQPSAAVKPADKLATTWGTIKSD